MGREIRNVPPNWQHPDNERGHKQPMYDRHFNDVFAEWLGDFDRIRANDMTDFERDCYPEGLRDWLQEDGHVPDKKYYRPWRDDEATWFQVWETVSEGTPVTPPFATKEELVEHLVKFGDDWQQERWQRGDSLMQPEPPGYSREAATKFVMGDGWVPTMVMAGGKIFSGIEISGIPRGD